MKKMKQLLTLLLILGLALGFRSFEQIGTKSVVIPFSDGKEGMVPSEETDAEIKAVLLEEVESFSDLEISTIVLTEEKEPVSEKNRSSVKKCLQIPRRAIPSQPVMKSRKRKGP